ncbi:MAG: hypothetical protein Q7U99_14670 [Rubrivivax sp.]|nr:hypothetical protein [Rubrivivax sp.]
MDLVAVMQMSHNIEEAAVAPQVRARLERICAALAWQGLLRMATARREQCKSA